MLSRTCIPSIAKHERWGTFQSQLLLFTTVVQLNIWALGFLISASLSPFVFGFLIARTKSVFTLLACVLPDDRAYISWRWSYGIASIFSALVLFLIAFFGRET